MHANVVPASIRTSSGHRTSVGATPAAAWVVRTSSASSRSASSVERLMVRVGAATATAATPATVNAMARTIEAVAMPRPPSPVRRIRRRAMILSTMPTGATKNASTSASVAAVFVRGDGRGP